MLIPFDEVNKLSVKTDFKVLRSFRGLNRKISLIIDSLKYMILHEYKKETIYVANVATKKSARGLGVGKLLMSYAEEVARNSGLKGISLIAKNDKVSTFYEKLNYKKVFDEIFLGERVIKMAKLI